MIELWRHEPVDDLADLRHVGDYKQETGHPPFPDAVAVAALHDRCTDRHGRAVGLPTRWWHGQGESWAAVIDLHRRGEHDRALVLARFVRWCDEHPHSAVRFWELRNVSQT